MKALGISVFFLGAFFLSTGFLISQGQKNEDFSKLIGMNILVGDQSLASDYENEGKMMTVENTNTNQKFAFIPYIRNQKKGEVMVKIGTLKKDSRDKEHFKLLEKLIIKVNETAESRKTCFKVQIISIGKAPDISRCPKSDSK